MKIFHGVMYRDVNGDIKISSMKIFYGVMEILIETWISRHEDFSWRYV